MAVFQEPGDAGATIEQAAGVVSIPEFDKIEGIFPNSTGDVDFYELRLETDARVNAELSDSNDGTNRFTAGSTGQVRYDPSNNLIQVEVGSDGDTIVDMAIGSIKDFSSVPAEDFIL